MGINREGRNLYPYTRYIPLSDHNKHLILFIDEYTSAKFHLEVIIPHVNSRLLLATKFFPPPPPVRRVKRRDLVSRIEDGLNSNHPLTLVSAPAGYGKSALAAEWRECTKRTVTWLALDESDNEPLRFFLYLTATLQKADETIGAELMTLLETNQLPPRETLIALLTEDLLASETSLVCVLDDFQSIQDAFILDILQELLAHQPLLQFVIVTREDPALPLGRLPARARPVDRDTRRGFALFKRGDGTLLSGRDADSAF